MLAFFEHPDQLTAAQYEVLKSAFHYTILPDRQFLIAIPSPNGYVYWANAQPDFIQAARQMLYSLKVKEIEK